MTIRTQGAASQIRSWAGSLLLHSVLAMVLSPLLGFFPEGMLASHFMKQIAPYSPAIAVVALILGYYFEPQFGRAAAFVWVVGAAWFAFGFHDTMMGWNPQWSSEPNRFSYAVGNLLSPAPRCSGSECVGELFITAPFAASITYSIGALVRKLRTRASHL